jgi:hypothetical protein
MTKTGKKVMIMAAGLSLAAAGILGGIFFHISRRETPDPGMERMFTADNLLAVSAVTGGIVIVLITAAVFIMARDPGGKEPVQQKEEAGTNDTNEISSIEQLIMNINDLNKEINRQAKSISQSMASIKQDLETIQTVTRNTADDGGKVIFNGSQNETFDHISLAK